MRVVTEIEQRFCQTPWGRACYYVSDNETPASKIHLVLFLHGLEGTGRYWFSYLEKLRRKDPEERILGIAPDLLGYGHSPHPVVAYTVDKQLELLRAVLAGCLAGLSPAPAVIDLYIIGHSLGGVLALHLAAGLNAGQALALPEIAPVPVNLQGLILLATPYSSKEHGTRKELLRSLYAQLRLARPLVGWLVFRVQQLGLPLVVRLARRGWLKPRLPLPVIEDFTRHSWQSHKSNAREIILKGNLDPLLDKLERTGLPPVFLIYGREDRQVPPWQGRLLSQRLRGSRYQVIEDAGHLWLGEAALALLPQL